MKAFQFRLRRVLDLRESEVKTEEARLEHLFVERAKLEQERDHLSAGLDRMAVSARSQPFVRSSELVALDQYKNRVKQELLVFAERLAKQEQVIEEQKARLIAARGRVKLLEKLREKRRGEWQWANDRELDELAADFSAAQWPRQQ